ncbi:glycosyltransferase [Piscinibacter sp. XHJ-5]|uniref:glycosyltransferase family 2 protein n=1 Tax=Piscinibacter sp. XHJ-5 TaxID=3037797 RepID=UPI002452881F|nr:glycosyltransferase [Piscinibacter sp. XHJ-5]
MTPRITLAVLAYRQAAFIDDAVKSALAQTGEPIEILLSDDASPDSTHEQMRSLATGYAGPHEVVVRRNPANLGIGAHFNEVVRAARGELIVMMAGDDLSLPDRVARVAAAWDASQQRLDLIASHLIDMDHEGRDVGIVEVDDLAQWRSLQDWAQHRPYIVGAAHAFTRRTFQRFGPLGPKVAHEDQVNLLRALCGGGAATLPVPLVRYRQGGVSDRMRAFTAEHFVARMRRSNATHVALHEQWLADARSVGEEALVENAIRREYGRELFLQALLAAPDLTGRWRATRRHRDVALGWRLRKFASLGMPAVAARIRAMQAASRTMRHGEGR